MFWGAEQVPSTSSMMRRHGAWLLCALHDVIDRADTRGWIIGGLKALRPGSPRTETALGG